MENNQFKELKNYVFSGDIKNIDKWFNKIKNNEKLRTDLLKEIINSPYFFIFSSCFTSLEDIQKEQDIRYVSIFKHFQLNEQLDLIYTITQNDKNISVDLFKLLNWDRTDTKQTQAISNSESMGYVISQLFNQEKFTTIDKIQDMLNIDFLTKQYKTITVPYKEKNSHGMFYLRFKEPTFSPSECIIFDFSIDKKNYLDSLNIPIPDKKRVEDIINLSTNYIKKSSDFHSRGYEEKIINQTDNYLKYTLYHHLTQTMQKNNLKSIKTPKI